MKKVRRIAAALAVSMLAVGVLGSSPANAKGTNLGSTIEKPKIVLVQPAADTSWG